jgi:hypothetical protein
MACNRDSFTFIFWRNLLDSDIRSIRYKTQIVVMSSFMIYLSYWTLREVWKPLSDWYEYVRTHLRCSPCSILILYVMKREIWRVSAQKRLHIAYFPAFTSSFHFQTLCLYSFFRMTSQASHSKKGLNRLYIYILKYYIYNNNALFCMSKANSMLLTAHFLTWDSSSSYVIT